MIKRLRFKAQYENERDKPSYFNPQEEIIRRQDFENKVTLMKDTQIKEYIQSHTFNRFELAILNKEISQRIEKNPNETLINDSKNYLEKLINEYDNAFYELESVKELNRISVTLDLLDKPSLSDFGIYTYSKNGELDRFKITDYYSDIKTYSEGLTMARANSDAYKNKAKKDYMKLIEVTDEDIQSMRDDELVTFIPGYPIE